MKNSIKIKLISLLGILMSVCVAFGMFLFAKPTNSASALSYNSGEFEMLGMSIRYMGASGDDGIRFGVKLKRSIYDELAADTNAVAGILIVPKDQVTAGGNEHLDIWTAAASHARYAILYNGNNGTNQWQVGPDYAIGIAYLDGFPSASYNRPIMARGYIDWNNDGNSSTVYHTNTVTKSMSDVALAVQTDAEGTFGTTAEQKTRLDTYLLNYTVTFVDDFYQTSSTQSVKYGSSFTTPSAPTARAGFTLNGWKAQNGVGTYSSSLFDMSTGDKTVKYAKYFKADYSTTSGAKTFEKPTIGDGMYELTGPTCSFGTNYVWTLKGCRFMNGATVSRTKDFMIQMTFTAVANAEYGFLITDDYSSGKGRINYHMDTNQFYVYNYTSGTYKGETWYWYDEFEQRPNAASALSAGTSYTMTLVYRFATYTVFIGNTEAISFKDTDELTSPWNNKSGKHMYDIPGTGATKYLGIMALNGASATNLTDWRWSTDSSVIDNYVSSTISKSLLTDGGLYGFEKTTDTVSSSTATLRGHYFMKGWTVPTCADFLVQTTFTAVSNAEMSLVITDDKATGKGRIIYKVGSDINFYNYTGGTYRDKTWHWNDSWEGITPAVKLSAGTTYTVTYVHKDGYFAVFAGSTRVCSWGDTAVPKAWGGNGGTATRTLDLPGDVNPVWYLGIGSYNAATTFTDWKVSVNPTLLANYSTH